MKYVTLAKNSMRKILSNASKQESDFERKAREWNEKQKKDNKASIPILERCSRNWKYMTMDEVSEAMEKMKQINPEVYKYLSRIIKDYSGKNYNYTYFNRAMEVIPYSVSQGIPHQFRWGLSVALAKSKKNK